MICLKASPYLFRLSTADGGMRVANLATGEILELDKQEMQAFNARKDDGGDFRRHAILVPAVEEIRCEVISRHREACRRPAVFNLTLMPTLACNLACGYCFEQNPPPIRMSDKTADAVIALTRREARRHLQVELSWYGGEPLLEMERIISLQGRIRTVCEQERCVLRTSITTNGYCLSEQNAALLVAAGIRFFHVTIDGEKPIHNANRPTKNGKGSFDRIFENIIRLQETCPPARLLIRVNAGPGTAGSILRVLERIPVAHRSRIMVHIDRIMGDCNVARIMPDWYNEVCGVSTKVRELGFSSSLIQILDPSPAVYCYAARSTSVVVDPRGWVYRCACTNFSESEKVGDLTQDGTIAQCGYFHIEWKKKVFLEPSECVDCEFLPLCGFGCPKQRTKKGRYPECRYRYQVIMKTLLSDGWVGSGAGHASIQP